jgi:aminopeptidase-like protein
MNISQISAAFDPLSAGDGMHELATRLYPICRSITGDGVRRTLDMIQSLVPIEVREVATGTRVFDWTVPREWNIRDAWIKGPNGEKVVDFADSTLHVMSYSTPVHRRMSLEELRPHLFSIPGKPDWIPYRTSYYNENWGFCLTHRQLEALPPGEYEVHIDSSLELGSLTYGECLLPGSSSEEILISCHICHPSLANDNLSGIAVATWLARTLAGGDLRFSYRFLFIPGTIGSITWLARNEEKAAAIHSGLVLTCVGDSGAFTYKRSRRGDTLIDAAMAHALAHHPDGGRLVEFSPYGYDERQFCSPGFNLPVGCLMRTEHGKFPEYHTSADNLNFVQAGQLGGTLALCLNVLEILELNSVYTNKLPKCEPQLGKRGLYNATGGAGIERENLAMLWVLNYSDGQHSLLEIAGKAGMPFSVVRRAAERLREHGMLEGAETAHQVVTRA